MKELLVEIFGTYTPITTTVPITDTTGAVIQNITLTSIDWQYILGVALFGLVLWSALRLVGIALKG